MLNIILEKPPETVDLDGTAVRVNTDFRIWMKIEEIMTDHAMKEEEKVLRGLLLCYGNAFESAVADIGEAAKAMFDFYLCGEEAVKTKKNSSQSQAVYSFSHDNRYIFAAFMEQYHIDLTSAKMHWWTFRALFRGLNENVLFSRIMGYRSMELSKIKDKEQRKHYQKLKDFYALPDMRSLEEKEADWGAAFL